MYSDVGRKTFSLADMEVENAYIMGGLKCASQQCAP